jgi:hypothetical protein
MPDIGIRGGTLHQLRTALGRLLIEFQADLKSLESGGLEQKECDEVKSVLKAAVTAFETHATGAGSAYFEVARHIKDYQKVYEQWNGHEGDAPGMPELRRRELSKLSEKRKDLFRKLAERQVELVASQQFSLSFVHSVRTPLSQLAGRLPTRFPRLRQATLLHG